MEQIGNKTSALTPDKAQLTTGMLVKFEPESAPFDGETTVSPSVLFISTWRSAACRAPDARTESFHV
ncbi:hypothetical protein OA90_02275 [Labrenzia sp. OB1]|nr:hypothetical protein OA90_02275 [Labrenzia sp. OB1]